MSKDVIFNEKAPKKSQPFRSVCGFSKIYDHVQAYDESVGGYVHGFVIKAIYNDTIDAWEYCIRTQDNPQRTFWTDNLVY